MLSHPQILQWSFFNPPSVIEHIITYSGLEITIVQKDTRQIILLLLTLLSLLFLPLQIPLRQTNGKTFVLLLRSCTLVGIQFRRVEINLIYTC